MSRGPGRWQRVLLDALARDNFDVHGVGATIWDHLGRPATRSEEVAARRAAKRIVETGQARAIYCWANDVNGRRTHHLALTRPDSTKRGTAAPLRAPDWITWGRRDEPPTVTR